MHEFANASVLYVRAKGGPSQLSDSCADAVFCCAEGNAPVLVKRIRRKSGLRVLSDAAGIDDHLAAVMPDALAVRMPGNDDVGSREGAREAVQLLFGRHQVPIVVSGIGMNHREALSVDLDLEFRRQICEPREEIGRHDVARPYAALDAGIGEIFGKRVRRSMSDGVVFLASDTIRRSRRQPANAFVGLDAERDDITRKKDYVGVGKRVQCLNVRVNVGDDQCTHVRESAVVSM